VSERTIRRRGDDAGGAVTAWTVVASPVDDLLLTTDGEHLTGVFFSPHKGLSVSMRTTGQVRDDAQPVLLAAAGQLDECFGGRRRIFDLPLRAVGTAFQRRVWAALSEIGWGETRSYGEIARHLGLPPGASRAVGLANGANPLSIVVPCHRVVGSDGSLTGFGGGVLRKRFLLDLEADVLF